MTVADPKGAELFYYVYDFLLYSTLVTSPLAISLGFARNREAPVLERIHGVCTTVLMYL